MGGVFGGGNAGADRGEEEGLRNSDEKLLTAEGAEEGRCDRREKPFNLTIAEEAAKGAKKGVHQAGGSGAVRPEKRREAFPIFVILARLGPRFVVEILRGVCGGIERHGVPFDFAQGGLSTAFGFRLTSLRMTGMKGKGSSGDLPDPQERNCGEKPFKVERFRAA